VAGKPQYDEASRARVYTTLLANEGNVKRTARETGVPESTVRRMKQEFETNPPSVEAVEAAAADFISTAKEVRDLALQRIKERLESSDKKEQGTLPQLSTVLGVLDDKITRVEGPTQRTQVDHIHHLPSADEARALLGGLLQGAIEGGRLRQAALADAGLVEQAEDAEFTALPSGTPTT
jgi:transposase-like protein